MASGLIVLLLFVKKDVQHDKHLKVTYTWAVRCTGECDSFYYALNANI
jgi:hypothetical protein